MISQKPLSEIWKENKIAYCRFDANGIPTHYKDSNGEEQQLAKKQSKKLAKVREIVSLYFLYLFFSKQKHGEISQGNSK